jgi:hypothetical protein
VLAEHIGDCLWVKVLSHDEKAIRFFVMANGLLVQALFSQLASLDRRAWIRAGRIVFVFRHLALPASHQRLTGSNCHA